MPFESLAKVTKSGAGSGDKEYYQVNGASHIQTYYVPEYVEDVVGKLKEFFGSKL